MSENRKTLALVIVAAAAALVAVASQRSLRMASTQSAGDKELFKSFDPLAAADVEIVAFDEKTATMRPFRVAVTNVLGKTRWSIPSHENYPTDAKDQLASAAGALMGLKVLDTVSEDQGDQKVYGVIDPDPKVKVGATGVGTRVVMKDKAGKDLLAMVIGKEVPNRPDLHYVRKLGDSTIYIADVKTDKLSTKFEDWIEPNLLQINAFDLKQIWIRDYKVDIADQRIIQNGDMQIEYNDANQPRWKLIARHKFQGKHEMPLTLAADEELNTAKLDELQTALSDLKIIDVSRKPTGLSADLKAAADFTKQDEAIESLADKGFFVASLDRQVQLFSNEGEIRLQMKDGVEYVLRFGALAGGTGTAAKQGSQGKDEKGESRLNRYLFVMAEFNPKLIAKPQLEPLPEVKKDDSTKPQSVVAPGKKADEKKTDESKPAGKADKKADEKAPPPQKPADKAADQKAKEADQKAREAERQRIEKENKRKQDEYQQAIAAGKKRVDELNARFADWYYVISEDVYRKIHLSLNDIVKKKEKKPAGGEGAEQKDDHAGHDHGKAKGLDAAAPDELEKLKSEGPRGGK